MFDKKLLPKNMRIPSVPSCTWDGNRQWEALLPQDGYGGDVILELHYRGLSEAELQGVSSVPNTMWDGGREALKICLAPSVPSCTWDGNSSKEAVLQLWMIGQVERYLRIFEAKLQAVCSVPNTIWDGGV